MKGVNEVVPKIFLKGRDKSGWFSSLKELIIAGIEEGEIEIFTPDLSLKIVPFSEIAVSFQTTESSGPVFQVELLGLTEEAKRIDFDSLKEALAAFFAGTIDYLQLYESETVGKWQDGTPSQTSNHQLVFLRREKNRGSIQFHLGDRSKVEVLTLMWDSIFWEGRIAKIDPQLPTVPHSNVSEVSINPHFNEITKKYR